MGRVGTLAALWCAALVLFVAGDAATTVVGLRLGAVEQHPVGRSVVRRFGTAGILSAKAAVVALCGSASACAAAAGRPAAAAAAPAVLAVIGAFATTVNALVMLSLL